VAQRRELVALGDREKAAEAAPCDVLEKDALDRVLGAEAHDLVDVRLEGLPAHP
jgi:hypothetical protein